METSQNKVRSFFNFLKKGLLLPNCNRRFFTAVYALILASTTLIVLIGDLGLQPFADKIQLDAKALNTTMPGSPDFPKLLQDIQNDTKDLLLVTVGYHLFSVVVGSATGIVVLFAAVFTYSGEERIATTFAALLVQVKAQIKGPFLTLAFGYVLGIASVVLMTVMASLLAILLAMQYFLALFVASLLVIPAVVCLAYLSFLCSFSVVVAVAEPGCHGAAALGKAWRLANGRKWQVVLYLAVTGVLTAVVWPVHKLARSAASNNLAFELLLDCVYAVLLALMQLFSVCAMTALYYERREIKGATRYAKVSTVEVNA